MTADGKGFVYALIDPRDHQPRYVGVTFHKDPSRRLKQHIYAGRHGHHLPVSRWIGGLIKIGLEPTMMWIGRWDDRDAYDVEIDMITRFRSYGHRLLNVTTGGLGGGTQPKSAEHRAKIGAAHKGLKKRPRTPEENAAHAAKLIGRTHSDVTRAKMRDAQARKRVLVAKTCKCGTIFYVLPSRVGRSHWCKIDCPAKTRG